MAFMIENINNDFTVYSSPRSDVPTPQGSYFRFYQTKLRQLVTQTRYRKEQEARLARQRQMKHSPVDQHLSEQRLHKEYINYIRERSKIQAQETSRNKIEESHKTSETIQPNINRSINLSVASSHITTTIESRPKHIVKSRQTPIPVKQQSTRIINASPSTLPNVNKPKINPQKTLDYIEENLSKSNMHSFTQVTSSSSRNFNHQNRRKSILDTIMLHLNTHLPSNLLANPTYEDIDQKFSSSIAPNVYENFQRIIT